MEQVSERRTKLDKDRVSYVDDDCASKSQLEQVPERRNKLEKQKREIGFQLHEQL